MPDGDSKPPCLKDAAQARAEDRERRRAAALRANLSRRKAQSRVRQADDQPAPKMPGKPQQ